MLSLTRTEWRRWIISLTRQPMLYAFIINILIRIPYIPHAQGSDAFVVIWMAQAIQRGFFDPWTINPLSLFALYPYSFYPIGGPFILFILFRIGFNVDSALLVFSFFFMCVSLITSYYLGKLIFQNDKILVFFFVIFYTTIPLFLKFTYWTSTVRGPFLAILPMVLYFNFKLIKDFNKKNFVSLLVSFIMLALMHRLVIFYPLYILALAGAALLIKYDLLNQKKNPIYLMSYILLFLLGILIFPIDPRKTTELILSNDSVLGVAWNLVIDYALRFGFIIVLAVYGFFKIHQNSFNDKEKADKFIYAFFLVFGGFSVFIAPISTYTSLLVLPWFPYFAVFGLKSIFEWEQKWIKYTIGISPIVFTSLYSFIVVILPIHLLGSLLLAIGSVFRVIINQSKADSERIRYFYVILCLTIFIFSRVSVDGLFTSEGFPFAYVSEDEITIAAYLQKYSSEKEIVFIYHHTVARRIQSLTFQPVIFPNNKPASIYYGWISIEEIRNFTALDIPELFYLGIPFKTNITFPEYSILSQFLGYNLRINYELKSITNFGVRYIITDNPPTGYWYTEYGKSETRLLKSIIDVGIIRVETRYLRLYEIPNNTFNSLIS